VAPGYWRIVIRLQARLLSRRLRGDIPLSRLLQHDKIGFDLNREFDMTNEPITEHDILCDYALRVRSPDYERAADLVRLLVETGSFPSTLEDQLDCFHNLQRFLFKWGGESLPTYSPEWRAIRSLFLLTAPVDLPPELQDAGRYSTWERDYRPSRHEHLAMISEIHFNTRYIDTAVVTETPDLPALLCLYDLERYLFGTVGHYFRCYGNLTAYDLFAIVIWKANRAKSIVAKQLLKRFPGQTLDQIADSLGKSLRNCEYGDDHDGAARLKLMLDYGFKLPMASAILTVLYPDLFTVYDVRACESLSFDKKNIRSASSSNPEHFWQAYQLFRQRVQASHPAASRLRDKDRALWADSFHRQLLSDIESGFTKRAE
jgi:hypothetical protein